MTKKGYRSLQIPEGLYVKLEECIEYSKGGYVSVSEVVREAIREFLKSKTIWKR